MNLQINKPLVFVTDDDPTFNRLMENILRKFGLTIEVFSNHTDLVNRLYHRMPSLFLIDLNLGSLNSGYTTIEIIRRDFSETLPIIVASTTTESASISHAIEIGATDYLFKPLDRHVFTSKLSNYLSDFQLNIDNIGTTSVGPIEYDASAVAELEFQVEQIDETGVTVVSKNLIPKGSVVTLSGILVEDIFGIGMHVLATAISNVIESNDGGFKAYLEFDSTLPGVSNSLRTWISKRK